MVQVSNGRGSRERKEETGGGGGREGKSTQGSSESKGYSGVVGEVGGVGSLWVTLEALFNSETVSKIFLLTSWREESLSVPPLEASNFQSK